MTKEEYLEYWRQWLTRTAPAGTPITVEDGRITMVHQGVRRIGRPVPCACSDPECLGWAMLTFEHKERNAD